MLLLLLKLFVSRRNDSSGCKMIGSSDNCRSSEHILLVSALLVSFSPQQIEVAGLCVLM